MGSASALPDMPTKDPYLKTGFAKVESDLHFLMNCFRDVLLELGSKDIADALPWIGKQQSASSRQKNPPPRLGQAYAISFQLLNMVEENAAAQMRRQRAMPETYRPESGLWTENLRKAKSSGRSEKELVDLIRQSRIAPVLTAHPTEAKRAPVLYLHREIYLLLAERENPIWTPAELEVNCGRIKVVLEQLWRTGELLPAKPKISDERDNILYYLREVFPPVLKRIDTRLEQAWKKTGFNSRPFDKPEYRPDIEFGTWVGGDRDGHPGVTPEVTRQSLRALRVDAMRVHFRELRNLPDKLSLSVIHQPIPPFLEKATRHIIQSIGARAQGPLRKFPNEPWKLYASLLLERLPMRYQNNIPTLLEAEGCYTFPQEMVDDLLVLDKALRKVHATRLARAYITPLVRALRIFGFHLAVLDIRQNSAFHEKAVMQLLNAADLDGEDYPDWPESQRVDFLFKELKSPRPFLHCSARPGPEAESVLDTYRLCAEHIHQYGPDGMGSLIVSMTRNLSDLLAVYLLAREAGLAVFGKQGLYCKMPVVPLFETEQDLQVAPAIVQDFVEHPVTRNTMRWRQQTRRTGDKALKKNVQNVGLQIMIGYSDSNKDAGILASQWALHRAQQTLATIARDHSVSLRFFHGRGGTISRGAGPTHRFLEALPHGSLSGDLRLTEQGETIAQKYANQITATYNLELLLAGVAGTTVLHRTREDTESDYASIAEYLAEKSSAAYRHLIARDGFIEFYSQATPIDALEHSRIGSRPARRTGRRSLDDLRAIPWVFSWNQSRFYLPGWFGVGSALETLAKEKPADYKRLKKSIRNWPYLFYVLNNVETNIASADPEVMKQYASLVEDPALRRKFMRTILTEWNRTCHRLDEIFGGKPLAERRPRMLKTLQLREKALEQLHRQQVPLLKKWRRYQEAGKSKEASKMLPDLLLSINAIASGLRTTG
jgi:phosphoenolpyruvate carboxylase